VLDESFSVFEYPSVSVEGPATGNATSLSIGGSGYDAANSTLSTKRTATELTVTAVSDGNLYLTRA
jgi:hypothetical protein